MRSATIATLICLCATAFAQTSPESEVADSLTALCRTARAGNTEKVRAFVDTDRMRREVGSWANRASLDPRDAALFDRGMAVITSEVEDAAASRPDILRIRMIEDGTEAIVIARHVHADGAVQRLRWRFVRGGRSWRVYDVGPIGYRMPLSLQLATGLDLFRDAASTKELIPISTLDRVAAALDRGETEKARKLLASIREDALPPRVEGVRSLFTATLLIFEDRPDAALAALVRAEKNNPGMPFVGCLRSYAWNRKGDFKKALEHATEYIKSTAGDAEGFHQAAFALARLERNKEAEAAFAKALIDDPGSLSQVAESLLTAEWLPALTALVKAGHRVIPNDPNLDFFDVQVLSLSGRHAEAAARLLPLLKRIDDDEASAAWHRFFLDEMIDAGRPLGGAAAVPGWPGTLRHVGAALVTSRDAARVAALALLHEERFPDDPWLDYFEGEARRLDGDHTGAEKAYAAGARRAKTEEDIEEFRAARVYNLSRAGKAIDALATIGPRGRTLKQLVWLAAESGDRDGLAALLAAQEQADATLPAYLYCRTDPAWLDGDHAGVVTALLAKRKEILADPELLYDFEDRVIRGLIRVGKNEQALAAAREIEKRDDDLWYVTLALASAGRVGETQDALARLVARGFTREQFYADEDLGRALRGGALRAVRAEFPEGR